MLQIIQQYLEWLAPYQFFSAFPQLVSRICHAQPEVSQLLQELIARLLAIFPQQAMWMMMAVSKVRPAIYFSAYPFQFVIDTIFCIFVR
jgi:hypothetical protein